MKFVLGPIFLVLFLALAGCEFGAGPEGDRSAAVDLRNDHGLVEQGAKIYAQNCARCHGAQGEGDPNWRVPGNDGFYPPPPLNGSGHAWHHSTDVLRQVIADGSADGAGRMPAWSGRLTARQIDAVIAWFQAQWPEDVYASWKEMTSRGQP